jgi:membrane protein required for colicin V production
LIWIDYVIIGLIALSAVIGLTRGFVREAFSLAGWGVAVWIAVKFGKPLANYFEKLIPVPSIRFATAFAVLFLTTLLLAGLVTRLLNQLVITTGLTGTDRLAGLLFGAGRGILLVAVLVFLGGLTPLPNDPWWRESKLIPPFQSLALWLRDRLPAGIASYVRYR